LTGPVRCFGLFIKQIKPDSIAGNNAEIRGSVVPSWRLKQEAEAKRQALQEVAELKEQLAEARAGIKSHREEWCWRRGKRA
jgi:hypothetical protein